MDTGSELSTIVARDLQSLPPEILCAVAELLSGQSHLNLALTSRRLWAILSQRAILRYEYGTITIATTWAPTQSFLEKAAPFTQNLILKDLARNGFDPSEKIYGICDSVEARKLIEMLKANPEEIRIELACLLLPELCYLRRHFTDVQQSLPIASLPVWVFPHLWKAILDGGLLQNLTYVELQGDKTAFVEFLEIIKLPSLRSFYLSGVSWISTLESSEQVERRSNLKILQFAHSYMSFPYWQFVFKSIECLEMFSYDAQETDNEYRRYELSAVMSPLLEFHGQTLSTLRLYRGRLRIASETKEWNKLQLFPNLTHLSCGWHEFGIRSSCALEDHSISLSNVLPPSLQRFNYHDLGKGVVSYPVWNREIDLLTEYVKNPSAQLRVLVLPVPNDIVSRAARAKGITVEESVEWDVGPFVRQDKYENLETKHGRFKKIIGRSRKQEIPYLVPGW